MSFFLNRTALSALSSLKFFSLVKILTMIWPFADLIPQNNTSMFCACALVVQKSNSDTAKILCDSLVGSILIGYRCAMPVNINVSAQHCVGKYFFPNRVVATCKKNLRS